MPKSTVKFPVTNSIWDWVSSTSSSLLTDKMKKEIFIWKKTDKNPTIMDIQKISKKADLPMGYFFASNPPKSNLNLLNFRTINNKKIPNPSRNLIDTIRDMQSKSDWLNSYRTGEHEGTIPFVGAYHNIDKSIPSQSVADSMLRYFHLKPGWNYIGIGTSKFDRFKFLRRLVSNYGILVIEGSTIQNNFRHLNPDEFRAFVLIDKYAPLIFINSKDYFFAQLFSLVHELVHIGYGEPEIFNYNFQKDPGSSHIQMEQDINKITAAILFPENLFRKHWRDCTKVSAFVKIDYMAKHFGTSEMATAVRAYDLSLIDENVVSIIKHREKHIYDKKSQKQKESPGHPSPYTVLASHLDKSLVADVIHSVHRGNTSYDSAFDLLNVKNTNQLHKLIGKCK